jgi:FlaA1/EpsC-like NDP-sugar epimerase
VLLTFVLLVQFGSFLSDLEERTRRGDAIPEPSLWRAVVFEPRRLVEVVVDFVLICASFLAAHMLVIGGFGTEFERSVFLAALPVLLAVRYVSFVALGVYRRVWRFATARDVVPIIVGCATSAVVAYLVLVAVRDVSPYPAGEVFVVDAVLCTLLVGASRLALRLVPEVRSLARQRRRVLVVGAGRAGRGLVRELHEGHEARVVGFLDDNPRVRRRRILGISVLGSLDEAPRAISGVRAEEVLVTIPGAPAPRLDAVVRAAGDAGIPIRIVHRRTEFSAPEPLEATLP